MENKTELIERLRKIANELENECKPEFEVGKHYIAKCYNVKGEYLIQLDSIDINYFTAKWYIINDHFCTNGTFDSIERSATESEVLEALTKEAVKRGLVKGANADLSVINSSYMKSVALFSNNYTVEKNDFTLSGFWIMRNGIWATVIKERSFEEWYKGFINSTLGVTEYIKSTKTELIEILKNLPND